MLTLATAKSRASDSRIGNAGLNTIDILQAMDHPQLANSVTIEIGTASFRSSRGYTYAAILADEVSFWRSEDSTNPDSEILAAVRPGMATIPNAMLLCASSPYARKGELWKAFHNWWGRDDAPAQLWKSSPTF